MTHFSTIGLIGHLNNERAVYSIKRLIRFLKQRNKSFVLEAETAALITDTDLLVRPIKLWI
jgi:NAD+ kinase